MFRLRRPPAGPHFPRLKLQHHETMLAQISAIRTDPPLEMRRKARAMSSKYCLRCARKPRQAVGWSCEVAPGCHPWSFTYLTSPVRSTPTPSSVTHVLTAPTLLQYAICSLQSAICHSPYAICSLTSTRNPVAPTVTKVTKRHQSSPNVTNRHHNRRPVTMSTPRLSVRPSR